MSNPERKIARAASSAFACGSGFLCVSPAAESPRHALKVHTPLAAMAPRGILGAVLAGASVAPAASVALVGLRGRGESVLSGETDSSLRLQPRMRWQWMSMHIRVYVCVCCVCACISGGLRACGHRGASEQWLRAMLCSRRRRSSPAFGAGVLSLWSPPTAKWDSPPMASDPVAVAVASAQPVESPASPCFVVVVFGWGRFLALRAHVLRDAFALRARPS